MTDELKKTRRFVDPRSSDKADKELASRWKVDLSHAGSTAASAAQGLLDAAWVSQQAVWIDALADSFVSRQLDTLFDSAEGEERKVLLEMLLQRLAQLRLQNSTNHAS